MNNPVNFSDSDGYSILAILIILGVTTIAGGAILGKVAYDNGARNWDLVKSIVLGAGLIAMGMAANGLASATLLTTIFAFGAVGSATVFAASAVVAGIGAIGTWTQGGSFNDGLNSISDYGETAMWSTAAGGAGGMLGGYFSHREQYPNSHYKILKIGRINGVQASGREIKGYPGVRYRAPGGQVRSIEIHSPHQGHGIHLQKNTWWLNKAGYEGQYYYGFAKHLEIFKFWKGWF